MIMFSHENTIIIIIIIIIIVVFISSFAKFQCFFFLNFKNIEIVGILLSINW